MKMKVVFLNLLLAVAMAVPASAHFQMVYTPEIAKNKGGETEVKLVFTHPYEAGHTMGMGMPEEFFMLHQKGEEGKTKKYDLKKLLKPITWTSLTNSGEAYEATLPKKICRSMGDYTLVLVPAPYYEGEEDIYIQQITKTYMNVGGLPGNWSAPAGLKTEWLPLVKPYAMWTGMTFKAQLLSGGKPVANADVEVEYMNHEPDMKKNAFKKEAKSEAPQDAFVTMGVKTDAQGYVTFTVPKAGWWGFCALGSGPDKEFKGKELSQDAVIWIKAVDM
ncbi:DUF4198 domain-containing protein [Desulfovibrio sp. JC010]|uniref:DUF4198 domain-containing protein n=1 Tax=Desulfovibrio sp. JC010 TaxID=2593641 RepID=UPI0013D5AD81|nr:DUF4198 domain-containing protein [Desulfovibrio sp. JC010]NDV26085.1 DUF4198 domain-containing protein [Desulfovibrio sp. JC010]